jgi:hypothetical protein
MRCRGSDDKEVESWGSPGFLRKVCNPETNKVRFEFRPKSKITKNLEIPVEMWFVMSLSGR